jgi:PiT family inorganic phosphate transporter
VSFLLLAVLLIIGFIVAFAIGSNDETMAPAVGARVFSVKTAVILGAVINLIGALSLGAGVSEKVGSELIGGSQEPLTITMVLAILVSMAVWLLLASITKGLPISTTQCIVGSVIGVVAVAPLLGQEGWGIEVIDWLVVVEILAGWVISPIIGFFISAIIFKGVHRFQHRAKGLDALARQEEIAAYGLALFLIITSLSRGGNDVANAVAPLIALPEFEGFFNIGGLAIPMAFIPLLVGGLGMGVGLIVVGRKVIRTLATEVVTLSPSSALSASISVSVIMFIGTLWGLPLSGTHVLVAALIGVGYVTETPVKMDQVKDILISWVITVPISMLFAFFIYAAFFPFV